MILPGKISPMLATAVEPFSDPNFMFEIKWDGYRCLIFVEKEIRLQSRNFKILNTVFPEFLTLHETLRPFSPCVVDGEIIAIKDGKPSFLWLQRRQGTFGRGPSRMIRQKIPVVFVAFDLLYANGRNICSLPLHERKKKLSEIPGSDLLIISEYQVTDGLKYYDTVKSLGLEGMVGKAVNSPYLPGKRTGLWRKCKVVQEKAFVICGYIYHPSSRGELSSLILGAYFDGRLTYYGNVGTGMSREMLINLKHFVDMNRSEEPPFPAPPKLKRAVWTKPRLAAKIQYLELTDDLHLRHPVFKELLPRTRPEECVIE